MSSVPRETHSIVPARRRRRWIRPALLGLLALLVAASVGPLSHYLSARRYDEDERDPLPAGVIDDASRMNRTEVAEVWPIPADPALAEEQLAALLRRAREQGLKVSIAGARHSMGGHTIAPDGIVVDMLPFRAMALDEDRTILRVGAGATWTDIVPYLDRRDRSPAVMQSNCSFSVGGSISVNCHGWQFGKPPIASTVERFRLMKADGEIVACSRTENPELFSLALGGYGLFGVILDVDLRVVPNERYRLEQRIVPLEESLLAFDQALKEHPDAAMIYARMGIVPARFLREVILNVFIPDPAADGSIPRLTEEGLTDVRRSLFRGSGGSDYGKELRWSAETRLQPHLSQRNFSRNQLLNEGVEVYENRSARTTDVLHEYFVPREGVVRFIEDVRRIIPAHQGDLLNVTVRSVETDADTILSYADRPMLAFVMLFLQDRTAEGEAAMKAMTRELIDAAIETGGRYYLCYRLHATDEQFRRAYPMADEFFERKRHYDPDGLFSNQFSRKYAPAMAGK